MNSKIHLHEANLSRLRKVVVLSNVSRGRESRDIEKQRNMFQINDEYKTSEKDINIKEINDLPTESTK